MTFIVYNSVELKAGQSRPKPVKAGQSRSAANKADNRLFAKPPPAYTAPPAYVIFLYNIH